MRNRAVKPLTFLLILGMTLGFASTGVAASDNSFSWETLGDNLCKYQLTVALGLYCSQELESEISSTQPSEVQFDIYENWAINQDTREQFITEKNSFLDTSFGMAQAKAKLTIIEARKNGSSQAEAQSMALEQVDEIYTKYQVSTLAQQEREAISVNETFETVNTTDNLELGEITEECASYNSTKFTEKNVTLYNGTKRSYSHWETRADCESVYRDRYFIVPDKDGYYGSDIKTMTFKSGTGVKTTGLNTTAYLNVLRSIDSQRTTVRNNVVNMTSFYYNEYSDREADNLSVSDELGPLETLITASTNYETTGSYSYLALTQAQAGHASNSSYAFHVQWNNRTAWGQLFVGSDAFNGTLEVNKTYDGSDETVIFVHNTENGKATETDINGQFKILEMRDTSTGEEVNSTKVQVVDFYTDGVQDLNNQLDEARTLHSNVTECPDCGGIIGPTGSWFADLFNDLFPDLPDLSADAVGGVAVTGSIVLLLIAVILG